MKREISLNKLTNIQRILYITKITGIMQLKYLLLIFVFTFISASIVSAGNKKFLLN
jgi:hypothetical protein